MSAPPADARRAAPVVADAIALSFGGRTIRFVGDGARVRVGELHTRFAVGDDVPADLEVRCRLGSAAPSGAPVRLEAGGTWELRARPDAGDEVCFYAATADGRRLPLIRLDLDPSLRTGRLSYAPADGADPAVAVGYPVDEYLASRVLGRAGAVILHACAVRERAGALVFIGHSGAGKSTVATLAEAAGAEVLSDDRTIVAWRDGAVRAWGTPWHGTYTRGSPGGAPVRALFLLEHGATDAVSPLSAAQAYKELLVRLIQPTIDRRELLAGLDTVERVVGAVAVARLTFRPTPAAYALARAAAEAMKGR